MKSLLTTLKARNSDFGILKRKPKRIFTIRKRFPLENVSSKVDNLNTPTTVNFNDVESKSENREHVQMFEKLFASLSSYTKALGIELSYDWIPHKNILFWSIILQLSNCWLCIFYTQYIHIRNGEIVRVLEAVAIYGIATSCLHKILCYLKKRHLILSMFFYIRKICRRTVCASRAKILTSDLSKMVRFWKTYAVGVASCLALFVACPFKSFLFDGKLMPLLPVEMFFVDQSTYVGYLIGNAVVAVMGIFASLGTVLFGTFFIFSVHMYSLQVNLIGQDFKDLDMMWAEGDGTVSLAYKHAFLCNICKKRQDLKNFMNTIKDIFEQKFVYYFGYNYLCQVICLFEITKNQWLPGYAIASVLFIEMMFYCVMGSQIRTANERLCFVIYTSDWYKYDMKSQKILLLVLHRSQQLRDLKLGPLGSLTVVTGIEVLKSIYTYYTVLTELL